jgi:hypothetical protein
LGLYGSLERRVLQVGELPERLVFSLLVVPRAYTPLRLGLYNSPLASGGNLARTARNFSRLPRFALSFKYPAIIKAASFFRDSSVDELIDRYPVLLSEFANTLVQSLVI